MITDDTAREEGDPEMEEEDSRGEEDACGTHVSGYESSEETTAEEKQDDDLLIVTPLE